jgi:hypothetical protein
MQYIELLAILDRLHLVAVLVRIPGLGSAWLRTNAPAALDGHFGR